MLSDFSPRSYQEVIFASAVDKNTLVTLPTGLGKTAIAMMLAARRFMLYPNSKIVFLAPTKPLVEQQLLAFKKHFLLSEEKFVLFTGSVPPAKRVKLWSEASIIFSTPQTLENDVLSNKISLKDVSLIVFDEAHRATGNYSYVFLAKEYVKQSFHQRILALTASPGTDKETIKQVMKNLFLENIEFRKLSDPDVKQFTQKVDVVWDSVLLSDDLKRVVRFLDTALKDKLNQVKQFGYLSGSINEFRKSSILKLQQELHKNLQRENSPELFVSISLLSQAFKIVHALELVQTQSVAASYHYLYDLLSKSRITKVRSIKNLVVDPNFLSALSILRDLFKKNIEHPKLDLLKEHVSKILSENPSAKILIFSQFRESANRIKDWLKPFSSELFFGQAKKNGLGLSQKQQKEVINNFSQGSFSCLIATSVAEEGLDIPNVDHVFFFEPLPSAIRSVQRRGRTGRHSKGFVTVLVTKDTLDEAFRWVSFHREKRMFDVLASLSKDDFSSNSDLDVNQSSLSNFVKNTYDSKDSVKVVVDFREKGSLVIKALRSLGVSLEFRRLDVGDYVISNDACIEFKNYDDFVDSIVDGRLLVQIRSLVQYNKPLLILQGSYSRSRNHLVDENAIRGMISTISLSYRIPIIRTESPLESAQFILLMAKREQDVKNSDFSFHSVKPFSDKEILEYVVSSLPGIGPVVAKSLLSNFDSLHSLFSASVDDLKKIALIGNKKAESIYRIIHLSYKDSKKLK